jgi:hypothetical protein
MSIRISRKNTPGIPINFPVFLSRSPKQIMRYEIMWEMKESLPAEIKRHGKQEEHIYRTLGILRIICTR